MAKNNKSKSVVAEIPVPAKKLPLAVVVANQKKTNAIRAAKIKNGEYKDVIAEQLKAEQLAKEGDEEYEEILQGN